METPVPEVHPPGDLCPDLPSPADAQHLRECDVGKDEGPLGVPGPADYPPPFLRQYGRKEVPYCAIGRGLPASQLCG